VPPRVGVPLRLRLLRRWSVPVMSKRRSRERSRSAVRSHSGVEGRSLHKSLYTNSKGIETNSHLEYAGLPEQVSSDNLETNYKQQEKVR
jgi:hypothetical protein